MNISFIVLTYNRSEAALVVLRSLSRQCQSGDEVIVADDGSGPEHVQKLIEEMPGFSCEVKHIWHPDTGFTAAKARNLAAYEAVGDYLVFLDGDCVPGPDFVSCHRSLAERGCFVNGSRVLMSAQLTEQVLRGLVDVPAMSSGFWWRAWRSGSVNKFLHLLPWPRRWRLRRSGFRWKGIRSCNFGLWRHDYLAVNGFDQVFEGWGHEDADLVLRLHNQGLKRKNGFWSTEVYHLWHHEHPRHNEEKNRQRVLRRQIEFVIRAEAGLSELDVKSGVVRTKIGRK